MPRLKPWEQGIPSSQYLQQQINKTTKYKPKGRGFLSGYISTNKELLFPIKVYQKNKQINPWIFGLDESQILVEKKQSSIKYQPLGKGALSKKISTNRYYYYYPYHLV